MSTPQERIETEVKEALKAGEKERLSTLRMLLASLKNERIRSGEEIDEAAFLGIVRKAVKERNESAAQYREGGREELAEKEEREVEILSGYLPPEIGEADLRAAVREIVEEHGLQGPGDLGRVMGEMMARFGGRADGGTIHRLAREILSAGD